MKGALFLMEDSEESLVGIVKFHLDSLDFVNCREIDNDIVSRLVEVFNGSPYGCDPDHDLNIIPAIIYPDDFQELLQVSNLTRNQLQLSLTRSVNRPRITTTNIRIQCLQGQHRVEAGKRFLKSSEFWWTVKLYCFEPTNYQFSDFTLREGERFSHETIFSDCEIYCKVRYWHKRQQYDFEEEWKLRLKESKRRDLNWLLKKEGYAPLLDDIVAFAGLRTGLELGNVRRHFALHCDEEIHRYLCHIYAVWDAILLCNLALRKLLDIGTVKILQGRAPLVSAEDRRFITRGIELGQLFPRITDPYTRQQILNAILELTVIIPTIKTLHENCKLLETSVKIIREHLNPDRNGPLVDSLKDIWRPPAHCLMEIGEGVFQRIELADNREHFYLAYWHLHAAAIRQFANLSTTPPRRDPRHEKLFASVQADFQSLFATRAKLYGFSNRKILETSSDHMIDLPPNDTSPEVSIKPSKLKQRYGVPFRLAYKQIQNELFLPNFIGTPSEMREISAMFVLHDFMKAFFRPCIAFEWNTLEPLTFLVSTNQSFGAMTNRPWMSVRYNQQLREEPINNPAPPHPQSRDEPVQIVHESPEFNTPLPTTPQTEGFSVSLSQEQRTQSPSSGDHQMTVSPATNDITQVNFGSMRESLTSPDTLSSVSAQSSIESATSLDFRVYEVSPMVGGLATLMSGAIIDSACASIVENNSDSASDSHSRTTIENHQEQETFAGVEEAVWNQNPVDDNDAAWESESSTVIGSGSEAGSPTVIGSGSEAGSSTVIGSGSEAEIKPKGILLQGRRSYAAPGQASLSLKIKRKSKTKKRKLRPKFSKLLRKKTQISSVRLESDEALQTPNLRPPRMTDRRDHRSYALTNFSLLQNGEIGQNHSKTTIESAFDELSRTSVVEPKRKRPEALTLQGSRSYIHPKHLPVKLSPLEPIVFLEYNGMKTNQKSTTDIAAYLRNRRAWVGMIIEDNIPRSLRLDHIPGYIEKEGLHGRTLVLVKQPHAERFRTTHIMKRRTSEEVSLDESSAKRTRV